MRISQVFAVVTFLLVGTLPAAETETWTADKLFETSVSDRLCLIPGSGSLEIARGVLIEDDGPAAGYSYKPNEETLKPGVLIKKTLLIPAPQASEATLLVGSNSLFEAVINGQPVPLRETARVTKHWRNFTFNPAVLKSGANEIVLRGNGKLWIARDDEYAAGSTTRTRHPNRSAKSTDGGLTWNDARLGTAGDVDGEYCVRVYLDQYRSQGSLLLPTLDVGNLSGSALSPALKSLGSVRLTAAADCPDGTEMSCRLRSGSTFVPGAEWSDWQVVAAGVPYTPVGRFLQLRVDFATRNPLRTPRLTSLTLESTAEPAASWTNAIRVLGYRNEPIIRSSIPFEYEAYDHPSLKTLRQTGQLDEVVKGAASQFEIITRLAHWTSARWQKMHLSESYPALERARNSCRAQRRHPSRRHLPAVQRGVSAGLRQLWHSRPHRLVEPGTPRGTRRQDQRKRT
ncbi:MAG TPA: hypothetical protein VEK08_09160 [Planctomycetota bacterium]|nr:hypothetical protein [Planctomycetota bacterium]